MEEVNEKSTVILTLAFTDEDGNAFIPDSLTYILYDKISGTERASGTLVPAASVDLELTPAHNAILDQNNRYEIAEVQVTYVSGTKTGRSTYAYKIINLPKTT